MEKEFWKHKTLKEFTFEEWEAVCDGCGKCCFKKFIVGHFKNKKLCFTRIACDSLDLETMRCSCYDQRFEKQKECTRLDVKRIREFKWLPESCSYRYLQEHGTLPDFHPLLNEGSTEKVPRIENPVHLENAEENFLDYLTEIEI